MQFSKMHGLSNDFVIINAITQKISLSSELIRNLGDRHIGIGFDQLLIIEPSYNPELDFNYRIFNADGNEVFQCANGARCLAIFLYNKGLINRRNIYISTGNWRMVLNIIKKNLVCVNMGEPNFEPSKIPFKSKEIKKLYNIELLGQKIFFSVVSMGNPHCIIQVDDIKTASLETIGPMIEKHELFPESVNISFMQIIKREYIRLRVYERISGETKSCGSGACAAVAAGIIQGLLEDKVCVELLGGRLDIYWKGPGYPLYMTGPAVHVYDGFINL